MAEIYYLIKYEQQNDFQKEQHISEIGPGGRDRVGFSTTQATLDFIAPRKAALQRDNPTKDPFDQFPNIYILPVEGNETYFNVGKLGGKRAFHLTCGSVDEHGQNFTAWQGANFLSNKAGHPKTKESTEYQKTKESTGHAGTKPVTATEEPTEPKPSLPFPG